MPALSAEAVKESVRAYAEALFGMRWDSVSVLVNLKGCQPEVLVVFRGEPAASQPGSAAD